MKLSTNSLLLDYINAKKPENAKVYDFLKEVYDRRFYHYGNHFKVHFESRKTVKQEFREYLHTYSIGAIVRFFQRSAKNPNLTVLSTTYFDAGQFLKEYSINVSRPPWAYNRNRGNIFSWKLFNNANKLKRKFIKSNFAELTSDSFIAEIITYQNDLKEYIIENNIIGLFVAHDIGFFEKLAIDTFKELKKPSFAFVHGLQFWLNDIDFSRSDYLAVWGESSKKDFVQHGMEKDRIIVTGHPHYKKMEISRLRFSTEHVLVLANALNGIPLSEEYVLTDRSNCIYYLSLIQEALMNLGVKTATLRPHPSENAEWYKTNIDLSFFQLDTDPLPVSLDKATMVIGPTSTVLLDALQHGVNYLVFNPENQFGKGVNGIRTPGFYNGEYPGVPCAKTPGEIEELIKKGRAIDTSWVNEIIGTSFSIEQVYNILQERNNL